MKPPSQEPLQTKDKVLTKKSIVEAYNMENPLHLVDEADEILVGRAICFGPIHTLHQTASPYRIPKPTPPERQ